jgi:hypothetical protein
MNTDPATLARLVLGLSKEGRFKEALGPCEALLDVTPNGDRMRLVVAEPFARSGRFEDAMAICDEVAMAEPEATQPLQMKAQLALDSRQDSDLTNALSRLFTLARSTIALNWIADRIQAAGWADLPLDRFRERLTGHAQTAVPFTFALLLVMLGRAKEVGELLTKAVDQMPNNPDMLIASAIAHASIGDYKAAQSLSGRALMARPFIRAETENGEASLLVVVDLIRGHFTQSHRRLGPRAYLSGNFPSEIRPGRIEIHKMQFQTGAFERVIEEIPPIDVVLSNLSWAGAEPPPRILDLFDTLVGRLEAKSINHPRDHIAMSRERNYQRWMGANEFVFPKTKLMTVLGGDVDSLASEIENEFDYPVIVRPPSTQVGGGMERIENADELTAILAAMKPGSSFYIIQYYETASDGGYYRKYRAAIVDGVPIPTRLDTRPNWMVHRQKNEPDYVIPKEAIEEEIAMQRDFRKTLPAETVAAIDKIAGEAPLDIFGIDFGYTAEGKVIVFETNAMMNLIPYQLAQNQPHFAPVAAKVQSAIEDAMIKRKGT